ncbi:MAG: glycosyltransferase family 2 protein [Bacteroidota bacterium]|nr:glycosyltransferase family 2 protein [Bacteroidota bacterium]
MNSVNNRINKSAIDVSIIVINYNTCDLLRDCLQSVVRVSTPKEIIVIDNASTDGSVQMVKIEFPEVLLHVNNKNERFAKPNNTAMKIAKGRYYFLLNSDATIFPDTLDVLLNYMETHPDVGICAPQLIYPDGSIQPSCRGFITLWTHFCDMLVLDRIFPKSKIFAKSEMTYFDHRSDKEVDHVMAAAILIKREAVVGAGMFDENLSINYNDLDLSYRIKQKGWKIVFFPEAQVIHHHSKTTKMMNTQFELFLELYSNVFYYFKKHYGKYSVVLYKLFMIIGFSLRTVFWFFRSIVDSSENTKYLLRFSWKSLVIAFPIWRIETL